MAARLAMTIVLLMLGFAPRALASSCVAPETSFDYAGYGPEVELIVGEMAALPAATILAGRYHDGANTVHPALLVSHDGGEDWIATVLPFAGAGVSHMTTDGADTVWGIVSFRQEGSDVPELMLRSVDGGRSWCGVPLSDLAILESVETFRFFDAQHGLLVFAETGFGVRRVVYQTSDGGDHWLPVWPAVVEPDPDVETEFRYPGIDNPPAHAPIWRQESGLQRIDGLLRIRQDDAGYPVERYDYRGAMAWSEISRIDRFYRIVDGRLVP